MTGEVGFDTGPFISAAAFCDSVIEGKDGVLSLIRIIDSVIIQAQGPEVPDDLPPGIIQSTLVLMFRAGRARGGHRLKIDLERPDGTTDDGQEIQINFSPGEHGGANLVMPMRFEVRSAGLHWFDPRVNGRLMTRVPLMVQYAFTRA